MAVAPRRRSLEVPRQRPGRPTRTTGGRALTAQNTPTRLTPGNWVAIAAIAVTVLGGVLGGILSIALGEHNRRIAGIKTGQDQLVAAQAQLAGSQTALAASQAELAASQAEFRGHMKAFNERLTSIDQRFTERFDRMEASIERLLQLHTADGSSRVRCQRSRRTERS